MKNRLNLKVIGIHIREIRQACGLTQAEVAASIGISDSYYGRIERGDVKITLNRLVSICIVLKTQIQPILIGCCKELDIIPLPKDISIEKKQMLLLIEEVSAKTLKMMYNVCARIQEEFNELC